MAAVVVGFGRDRSLRSRLIRWATAGRWSHTWLELHLWGGAWALHSGARGVAVVPLRQVTPTYTAVARYAVAGLPEAAVLAVAHTYVGRPYDYRAVLWNGLLLVLLRLTGWQRLHDAVVRDAARYSCSELVAAILGGAGLEGLPALDPELTTPQNLADLCAAGGPFSPAEEGAGAA